MSRAVVIVLGVIALVVGIVFMGQGANLIPGSFMTGDRTWLWIGFIVAVVGALLIALGARRRRPRR